MAMVLPASWQRRTVVATLPVATSFRVRKDASASIKLEDMTRDRLIIAIDGLLRLGK
jgi:hypothetical protein